jgi:hypothetical protein
MSRRGQAAGKTPNSKRQGMHAAFPTDAIKVKKIAPAPVPSTTGFAVRLKRRKPLKIFSGSRS